MRSNGLFYFQPRNKSAISWRGLSTFDFRLSTFDFRLSTFDFRLSTFDFTQTLSSSAPSCSAGHSLSQTPFRSENSRPRCNIPPSSPSKPQFPPPLSPPAKYETSPPPPPPTHRRATSNPRRSTPESSRPASRSA